MLVYRIISFYFLLARFIAYRGEEVKSMIWGGSTIFSMYLCSFFSLFDFFKLTYLMVISTVLSTIPGMLSFLKGPIYNWAALTCFRILSRSFSGVIRFHNKQYRPNSDGICVANHTTPIDVVVLSCDRSYALVTCKWNKCRAKFCSECYQTWTILNLSVGTWGNVLEMF